MKTNFIVYLIGYVLVIAGVWYGLDAAGVSQQWTIVVVLILAGLGIIYAFSRAQSDTAQREQARNSQSTGGGAQQGGTQQQGDGGPQGNTQT